MTLHENVRNESNLSFAKPVSSDLKSAAGIEGQIPSYEAPSPRWRMQTPEESHRSIFKFNGSICIYPDRVTLNKSNLYGGALHILTKINNAIYTVFLIFKPT